MKRRVRVLFAAVIWFTVGVPHVQATLRPAALTVRATPEAEGDSFSGASIHALPGGRALVIWMQADLSTDIRTAYGRFIGSDARPEGEPFKLNLVTGTGISSMQALSAAVQPDGSFLARWHARDPADYASFRTYGRSFDADGTPRGPEFVLQPTSHGLQLTAGSSGGFAALMEDEAGGVGELRLVRLDENGARVDSGVVVAQVPSATEQLQAMSVASLADDSVVLAWTHSVQITGGSNPKWDTIGYMRHYDVAGTPLGPASVLYDPAPEHDFFRIFLDIADQNHVLASWTYYDRTVYRTVYRARRLLPDGTLLHDFENPSGGDLAVHGTSSGHIVGTFEAQPDDYVYADYVQSYDATGAAVGTARSTSDDLYLTVGYRGGQAGMALAETGSVWILSARREVTQYDAPQVGYTVRRMCESGDATCRICPDHDDSIDADADGEPDGCDPCTNVDGTRNAFRPSVEVAFGGEEPDPEIIAIRDNRVAIEHRFFLPAGVGFADLPVMEDGARVRIESLRGDAMVDETLPGGAYGGGGTRGWIRKGSKIAYQDRTHQPVNGFRRIVLKDLGRTQPGMVSVQVKASGGNYAVDPNVLPMAVQVTLGGIDAADEGVCSESAFTVDDCEFGGSWTRKAVRCSSR